MKKESIVAESMINLVKELQKEKLLNDFILGGGTALSLS
jgi:hypothetical protein